MIIGACAAHRTGKSTLAQAFVNKNPDYTFVPTSVSAIMKAAGYDPGVDYPILERLQAQHKILDGLDRLYSQFTSMVIFDRTPLDAAAYLLADVQRQNVPPAVQEEIVRYVNRAIEITNRRFALLLFLPPVLPLIQEEGKAPAEPAYVEHISQIINGMRHDERIKVRHISMPRAYTDLDLRVDALTSTVGRVLRNFEEDAAVMRSFNSLH